MKLMTQICTSLHYFHRRHHHFVYQWMFTLTRILPLRRCANHTVKYRPIAYIMRTISSSAGKNTHHCEAVPHRQFVIHPDSCM